MPTDWALNFLPKAQADLQVLEPSKGRRRHVVEDIEDAFRGMKGDRVTKALYQGASSTRVVRLKAATTPGSLRVRVHGDLRATVLCLPAFRQVYVTYIFHKSQDPDYKTAPAIHDARVREFVAAFTDFVGR